MEENINVLINLIEKNCQSLTFTTASSINKEDLETLGLVTISRLPLSFYQFYEAGNKKHMMRIRLIAQGTTNKIVLSIIYNVLEKDRFATIPDFIRKRKPASEQFKKLCELKDIFLFKCETIFVNKRGENVFFPFPLKFGGEPNTSSYDEVRGMRLVKAKENKILIENYIDMIDPDTLSQTIKFAYEAKFTEDLPLTILGESKKLTL